MPVATATELLATLRQLQFLKLAQLDELARKVEGKDLDARTLARKLIEADWLTPYQANQLLQTGGKDLVLGSYVLLERLGEGGMGQVFKARHRGLDRVVALKLIHKERLDHPQAVKRFHREIQAAAALSHPNIVLAYDADQCGNIHFLTMEYVEGTDLARRVKEVGPLPIAEAYDYIRQAALGLQHAFEKGMVHRDIKPHNLLVATSRERQPDGSFGVIKILDMGLARLNRPEGREESSTLTTEGSVMGTLDYIAPEQAMDSHTVDIRADLYSLGCTFYFLLTGQVPFPGGDALAKLMKHKCLEPVPLEQLRPDVPSGVAAVVYKLMAKNPEDRFQTPAELADVLASGGASFAALTTLPGRSAKKPEVASDDAPTIAADALRPNAKVRTALPARRRRWLIAAGVSMMALLPILFFLTGAGRRPRVASALLPNKATQPENPYVNSLGMEFVLVRKGTAWLGGTGGKPGEKKVEIPHDFYLGVYEVTQQEWQTVTGVNPSWFSREGEGSELVKDITHAELKRFPVERVSWEDAKAFLSRLNAREQKPAWIYRLPTSAEWEYACRGGQLADRFDSAFDFYLNKPTNQLLPGQANFEHADALKRTCKVGSYPPNRLGLHDMHGNVWEWCQDAGKTEEGEPGRLFRGGSYQDPAAICAASISNVFPPTVQYGNFGLRLARVSASSVGK